MNKPRILVVEDESHLAILIKFNLEREGYQVTTVGDGPSALKLIEEGQCFELVILDLMLPHMSGYAVCESIRGRGMNTPVLILSARTLTEDRIRGFDVGANQYLTKPFDLDELLSRTRNLLGFGRRGLDESSSVEREEPEQYRFGEATIDFRTFDVSVGGNPIRLTQLEMKLLQYLVRNEGRVVSRQELLENVWKIPGQLTTRAVDQFILRLRKAFEPDPANPRYFRTIRDAGYRFTPSGE
jgi:two-component system, OmpR family, alkaline phosphatase synthesis response regulator PhoP